MDEDEKELKEDQGLTWEGIEALRGQPFVRYISREKRLKALLCMARGIKRAINERQAEGLTSPNAEQLFIFASKRYALAKKQEEELANGAT